MRCDITLILLLLTAGLTLMSTGPLIADEAASPNPSCENRLIRIEQRLDSAGLPARKQGHVRQIIDGARTLGQLGDAERGTDLANQLDRLLETL